MLVKPFYCEEFMDYIHSVFGWNKYTNDAIEAIYKHINRSDELCIYKNVNKNFIEETFLEFKSYYDLINYLIDSDDPDFIQEDIYNKNDTQNKIEEDCKKYLKMTGYYDYYPLSNKNILLVL